jgi:ABC-type Zn uptake system ZnuABC Zn-binding protein ZnuA
MYGATLPPVFDWLSALGAPVVRLQPPGAEAHDVALTTRIVWRAAKCRRIFGIGLSMESYLAALQTALGKRCPPIERLGEHLKTDDPHIWFDTRHARTCLQRMTLLLGEYEPGRRASYHQRLRQSQQQLDALDTQIKRIARKHQGKYYIAQHDAFRLLTRRIGLNSLGSFQPDHERPPSLSHLLQLIKRARSLPLLCVIGSERSDVGENLAHELRVPYLIMDTQEHPHPQRDYFERMRVTLEGLERL